jgi:hypothetical protein
LLERAQLSEAARELLQWLTAAFCLREKENVMGKIVPLGGNSPNLGESSAQLGRGFLFNSEWGLLQVVVKRPRANYSTVWLSQLFDELLGWWHYFGVEPCARSKNVPVGPGNPLPPSLPP